MFTVNNLEEDKRLDNLVKKILSRNEFSILSEYEIMIRIFWIESLRGDYMSEIKATTPAERYSLECDVIIFLSAEKLEGWGDKDIETAIAHHIMQIEPQFVGRDEMPKIIIKKDYYQIYSDIIQYYGKGTQMYKQLFEAIDNSSGGQKHHQRSTYDDHREQFGRFHQSDRIARGQNAIPM